MNNHFAIAVAGGVGAAALTHIITRVVKSAPSLVRENHRGETVSLSEGVGVATSLIGSAVARQDFAAAAAIAATGNAGLADDLDDVRDDHIEAKGLRGHFEALRSGNVTTGTVKMVSIGSAAAGYALIHGKKYDRGMYDWVIDSIIIAGSANVINLFDLRPGRALKVAAACSMLASAGRVSPRSLGATVGTIVGAAPTDFAGKTMLGDVGANTLGMQVGMLAATPTSKLFRTAMALATLSVIAAGEVTSFSKVIDESELLSKLDQLGVKTR
ncbi:MAG: hypothetical protein Q4E01_03260 [Actinomycetaceae bacterium]|nr:hypothetical protein [Actinomycetaceae bacterium]